MPLSYGAPVDVPQRATGLEKEMRRMLNTKPKAPDTPHPSLSAPQQPLFARHSRRRIAGLSGAFLTHAGIILKGPPTEQTFRGI